MKATTSERVDIMSVHWVNSTKVSGGAGPQKSFDMEPGSGLFAGSRAPQSPQTARSWGSPVATSPREREWSGALTSRDHVRVGGSSKNAMKLSVDLSGESQAQRSPRRALGSPASARSFTAKNIVPYCLTSPRHPPASPPYKLYSQRSGNLETVPRERPVPWALGELASSVCYTPDLHVGRWPAPSTSVSWRSHGVGMHTTVSQRPNPWYTPISALSPRGIPAPGGGPNQFPKGVDHVTQQYPQGLSHSCVAHRDIHDRPTRPFTNASAQRAHVLVREALDLFDDDKPLRAEKKLLAALEVEPNSAEAMGLLGRICVEERQEYHKAEELWRKALIVQPDNAAALAGLASLMENVYERYDYAEQLYQHALEFMPNDLSLLLNYAFFVQKVHKDSVKTREYVLRAAENHPHHPWIRENAHKF